MKLLRLLRLAPLALMFAGVASAQTTGTIIGVVSDAQSGKPVVGALVIATSPNQQGEQTVITDASGAFRLTLLPPGAYKLAVQLDGYKPADRSDLNVSVDKTIRANLSIIPEAVQMEEQVVRTGVAPVINVGSAETGSVVSQEFVSNIPVGRGFETIARVAPSAVADTYGVSFAGSSSPENNYILDGMNITDAAYGTLGAELISNFLQEIDVKSGAFMPEYGFSTGGIINVVTKSGSNEFHGSVFGNWEPGQLRPTPKAVGRDAEALALRNLLSEGSYRADFGFEVGGPIMKDRLWFYVGFAPVLRRTVQERFMSATVEDPANPGEALRDATTGLAIGRELPGFSRRFDDKTTSFQLTSKLTYLFNENNNLSVSFMTSPSNRKYLGLSNAAVSYAMTEVQSDFTDVIARYSSKLLDKRLLVEVMGGWHHQLDQQKPGTVDGVDQKNTSGVQWLFTHPLSDFEAVPSDCATTAGGLDPCVVTGYATGGYGFYDKTLLDRFGGKASATYLASFFGSHQLKAGVDIQRSSYDHTKGYSGGKFLRERTMQAARNTTLYPTRVVSFQNFRSYGTVATDRMSAVEVPNFNIVSETNSRAYYLQDSYSPIDGLTLNGGIRWETQDMTVPDQAAAQSFTINDNIGPRLSAIYDFTKQGRSAIKASWGRFYQSVPLDMGDRAFGDERQINNYFAYCVDPSTVVDKSTLAGAPEQCPVLDQFYSGGFTYSQTGSASTPVHPNLKGQYVDMYGVSAEYEVLPDLSVGVDYTARRLGRVIEDLSNDDGVNYAIANPGEGKPWDLYGDGTIFDPKTFVSEDLVTGRTITGAFPKPKREYDGVTFTVRKNLSNHWQAQASYTYSSFRGNYPGLFRPETAQLDPNLTSEFDLASLLANREGPLPGDVPHQVKAYGSYTFDFGPRMNLTTGAALTMLSGTPVNYLGAHPLYGTSEGFILPRGSAGRTPFTTQFDLKGSFGYTISPPYAVRFSVDVFNLFNSQEVTNVDQNWTTDDVNPIQGGQCSGRDAVPSSRPIAAAFKDCPDLQYMKTLDGRPVTVNKNFGRPSNAALRAGYQTPLTVRFGLEVTF
jgi:hypothetical protein